MSRVLRESEMTSPFKVCVCVWESTSFLVLPLPLLAAPRLALQTAAPPCPSGMGECCRCFGESERGKPRMRGKSSYAVQRLDTKERATLRLSFRCACVLHVRPLFLLRCEMFL